MRIYKVKISRTAYLDMSKLRIFLRNMLSEEGAVRYAENMRTEIKMLSVYAECHGRSTSKTLRQVHPDIRRMISHNRRWIYLYHIEGDYVIVDRIFPSVMNKG